MVPTWVAILVGQIISNKIHYNYSIIYIYIYISLYIPIISNYIIVYPTAGEIPPFSHLGEVHAKQVVTHLPHLVQTCHQVLARHFGVLESARQHRIGPPGPTSADLVFPRSWRQFEVLGVSQGDPPNSWSHRRYLQKWVKLIGWYVNHQSNFATWGLKPDPKKVVDYWVTSWYVTREGPCRSRLKFHIDNHQNRRPKKDEQSSWSHDLSPK